MTELSTPAPRAHPAPEITLAPFDATHIAGALRLSQAAGWPHLAADWALTLSVSQGVVALKGSDVVGTALCSAFGDVACLNMIIVDADLRGQGLGRRLMEAVIDLAGSRELRLTATAEGLPLYEKLGFVAIGEIYQHQGIARDAEPELPVTVTSGLEASEGLSRLAEQDLAASGMARGALIAAIAAGGEVLRSAGGFALLRVFGRGRVLGPVVARDSAQARALIAAGARRAAGSFLRLDLTDPALAPEVEALGLVHVGGGTAMVAGAQNTGSAETAPAREFKTYALASQALG